MQFIICKDKGAHIITIGFVIVGGKNVMCVVSGVLNFSFHSNQSLILERSVWKLGEINECSSGK